MLPGYGYMGSFPHQGNSMPFMQFYQPNGEDVPEQTMIDPSKYASYHGSYPCGGYYGCPAAWHTCSNNSSFPGYVGYRPSCYHPRLPYLYCGSYNFFPQGYPVQYFPPLYYGMDPFPRSDREKIVPQEYHCCGCSHHKSNQKHGKGSKIESEEPDSGNGRCESLIPFQLKNCPNSVVWIPKQYNNGEDCGMPVDQPKVAKEDVNSGNGRHPEKYVEEEPRKLEWFPFDLNSLKSLMRDGGTELSQGHENQKNPQFSFPNLWIPSYGEQGVAQKALGEVEPGHSSVPPSGCNVSPPEGRSGHSVVQPSGNRLNRTRSPSADESTACFMSKEENSSSSLDSNATNKTSTVKDIPVKRIEADKHETKDLKREGRDAVAERAEDNALCKRASMERQGRAASENQSKDDLASKSAEKAKRQSKSPPRSKLPPVCLRVDPLPKKKANNGSPRSPLDLRGHLDEKPVASAPILEGGSRENPEPGSASRINEGGPERKKKTIQVMEIMDNTDRNGNGKPTQDVANMEEADTVLNKGRNENTDAFSGKGTINDEIKGVSASSELAGGKRLSDEEAAAIIQSVYRGHEVRRWEPITKFKQIVKIREQMEEVKKQIETLAPSSGLRKDDRQELTSGERIMTLLLELDKIQGLHPSLRDIRKSVARELVTLQEKLDSIMLSRNKTEPGQGMSNAKATEDDSTYIEKEPCAESRELNERGETGMDQFGERHSQAISDAKVLNAPYSAAISQGEVDSGPLLVDQQSCSESDVVTMQELAPCELKIAQPDAFVEANDMQAAEQLGVSEHVMAKTQEKANKDLETGQELEFCSGEDVHSSAQSESVEHASDQACRANLADNVAPAAWVNMLEDLTVGVLDDDAIYDLNEDVQAGLEEHNRKEDVNLMNEGFSSHSRVAGFPKAVDDAAPVPGIEEDNQTGINISYAMGTDMVLSEGDYALGKRKEGVDYEDNLETHTEVGQQGMDMSSANGELMTEEMQGREVNGSDNYSAVALEHDSNKSTILQAESKNDGGLLETSLTGIKQPQLSGKNEEYLNRNQEEVAFSMKDPDFAAWKENTCGAGYASEEHPGIHEESSLVEQESDSYSVNDGMKEELCSKSPTDGSCEMKTSNSCDGNVTADKGTTVAGKLNLQPSEENRNTIKVAARDQIMEHADKLLESGRSQLDVINYLNGRVKDLEKKLARRRRVKTKRLERTHCGTSRRK